MEIDEDVPQSGRGQRGVPEREGIALLGPWKYNELATSSQGYYIGNLSVSAGSCKCSGLIFRCARSGKSAKPSRTCLVERNDAGDPSYMYLEASESETRL